MPPLRLEQNLKPHQSSCGFCKEATSLQTAGDPCGLRGGKTAPASVPSVSLARGRGLGPSLALGVHFHQIQGSGVRELSFCKVTLVNGAGALGSKVLGNPKLSVRQLCQKMASQDIKPSVCRGLLSSSLPSVSVELCKRAMQGNSPQAYVIHLGLQRNLASRRRFLHLQMKK